MDTEVHKITVTSPHAQAPHPERFGVDPYYQHKLLEQAVRDLLRDPFRASRDLRGVTMTVELHDDGLSVTACLEVAPLPEPDEALLRVAERLIHVRQDRQRRVEDNDILRVVPMEPNEQ